MYALSSEDMTAFATTRAQTRARVGDQEDSTPNEQASRMEFRHVLPVDDTTAQRKTRPAVKVQQPGEPTQFSRDKTKPAEEPVAEPPIINTERGWREREQQKKQARKGDEEQAGRVRGKAGVRFTSDVQDLVSPEQVQEKILNTVISIPLKMILAVRSLGSTIVCLYNTLEG